MIHSPFPRTLSVDQVIESAKAGVLAEIDGEDHFVQLTENALGRLRALVPDPFPQSWLIEHVYLGWPHGHFVTAVLENNGVESFARADEGNKTLIPGMWAWLYNYAPRNCWGSEEKVTAWLELPRRAYTVACQFCGEPVNARTAHAHGGGWVGDECCWDERLRAGDE